MCGIVGVVEFNNANLNIEAIKEMSALLSHRGPDDTGLKYWTNNKGGVALGHRRLSIIDLSPNGSQPMSNEDGDVWIVFNGEIYNYLELREELIKSGHIFKSDSDTEVIIHQYEEEGEQCVKRLNGMFAFGIWDQKKSRLLLARDRIGVKPLVYMLNQGTILFASEIKSLLKYPGLSRDVEFKALELYFTFNFVPAPFTIYSSIRKLPPGCYLTMDFKGHQIVQYWDITNVNTSSISTIEEAIQALRSLLEDAVRIRLFADVPLGAFLSGGVDSSIIVAIMSKLSPKRIKTYSIGFSDDSFFDETHYACTLANMYNTDHHEIRLRREDFYNAIEETVAFFDEPFGDPSALPTNVISRETRRHVKVALSGDGGDELFGGYRRYLGLLYHDLYTGIPLKIREHILNPLINILPESRGNYLLDMFRQAKIFVNGVGEALPLRHYKWLVDFIDHDREKLFQSKLQYKQSNLGIHYINALLPTQWSDSINQCLAIDFKLLLPFDMLTKVDWMSMNNGLEIRSPFLDYRLAELAFQLPGIYKVNRKGLKYLIKIAFKDLLPSKIQKRRKQGFELPIGTWLKHDEIFRRIFWRVVDLSKIKHEGILNPSYVEYLFNQHLAGVQDNSQKLWSIFVWESWMQGQYRPTNIIC